MRYLLGYQTHVSLNEIDNYNLYDMINQLEKIYEYRMQESGKSFVRKPKKEELELAEQLKKSFKKENK
jgi:hypothetical protein